MIYRCVPVPDATGNVHVQWGNIITCNCQQESYTIQSPHTHMPMQEFELGLHLAFESAATGSNAAAVAAAAAALRPALAGAVAAAVDSVMSRRRGALADALGGSLREAFEVSRWWAHVLPRTATRKLVRCN